MRDEAVVIAQLEAAAGLEDAGAGGALAFAVAALAVVLGGASVVVTGVGLGTVLGVGEGLALGNKLPLGLGFVLPLGLGLGLAVGFAPAGPLQRVICISTGPLGVMRVFVPITHVALEPSSRLHVSPTALLLHPD